MGRGGSSKVYLVRDDSGELFALKRIKVSCFTPVLRTCVRVRVCARCGVVYVVLPLLPLPLPRLA
jgi:hypothetical protein